jgi:hypothetical protein
MTTEAPTINVVKVRRVRDAQYAICRVDGCMNADALNSWWGLSSSKWMHETGIGAKDPRHRVDYYRIESIS